MRSCQITRLFFLVLSWSIPLPALAGDAASDPSKAEVRLPAQTGWHASLLLDNDVGVWTVGGAQIFPRYGCPEVFGLDDKGRCVVLVSYSGKWTPVQTVHDGAWLGALQLLDLDPHLDGKEIYTGGKKGNLFQIRAHHEGDFDTRVVDRFPGEEIHTLVGGELVPGRAGEELLGFSRLGLVWDIRPPAAPGEPFSSRVVARLGGRVRQALLLPAAAGETPWIAATCRFGQVLLLRFDGETIETRTICEEPMGFGRIALRRAQPGEPVVLYASRDDGVILRLEGNPGGGSWRREVIYAGPQGPRGVASGRFHANPDVETVAVFGYSKRVQLLSRPPGGAWKVETLFEDRDKGHWLSTVEIDGRNATDELVGSGYGKRIFALSRPPGYGLSAAPTDPDPEAAERDPLRVAVRVSNPDPTRLNPLIYRGGFVTKSLIYETLVRRDQEGRIVPGLARSWRFEDQGLSLILTLRSNARFHDGTPVDAQAVRDHLERWVRLPEHAWLHSSERVRDIVVLSPSQVKITTDRPTALLQDLVAINPCAIRAPGAVDNEGNFVRPIGSGPFAFAGTDRSGRRFDYRRANAAGPRLEMIPIGRQDAAPIDLLLDGEIDLVVDGWYEMVPRDRVAQLRQQTDIDIIEAPGSAVVYIGFQFDSGATANRDTRRRIAAAVDRTRLVARVEQGEADPCSTFASPSVRIWPAPADRVTALPPLRQPVHLQLLLDDSPRQQRLGPELEVQLAAAGFLITTISANEEEYARLVEAREFDLRIETTWGVPYDPHISLVNRFLPPPRQATAARRRDHGVDPRLAALVLAATRTPDPDDHPALYARMQQLIDDESLLVPLYTPRRLAAVRSGIVGLSLDHDLYHLELTGLRRGT